MRKYRKWVLTLGLVAAAPTVGLAGPFDAFRAKPEVKESGMTNQQVAESVAAQLRSVELNDSEVDIQFERGTLTLTGKAADAETKALIGRVCKSVPGVQSVRNDMKVDAAMTASAGQPVQSAAFEAANGQQSPVQQVDGMASGNRSVMPVEYMQDNQPGPAGAPVVGAPGPGYGPAGYPGGPLPPGAGMAPGMMPPGAMAPGMMPQGGMPPGAVPPPPPAWAQGAAAPSGAVYDQPALPEHAWPSYAAYPNYAALTYPRQHSASAWPYIGPFYPYPQVPLGWRDVNLQWDDGHWYLDFNDRTDRWWWFLNPKKW